MARNGRHRPGPPPWYQPAPTVLTDEYQHEVDRATAKLERQYRQAEKRAEQAENRLARAKTGPPKGRTRHALRQLEAQVELRRAELEEYRRMMESTAASAEHRGTRSFRPVPTSGP